VESPAPVTGAPAAAHHIWLFLVSFSNCSPRAISCFNIFQYLNWFDISLGTFVNLSSSVYNPAAPQALKIYVNASIGSANEGVAPNSGYLGYGSSANLLSAAIRLPVGTSTYKVIIITSANGSVVATNPYTIWANLALRPVVITARGQLICCSGKCSSFEKTEVVSGECLPSS